MLSVAWVFIGAREDPETGMSTVVYWFLKADDVAWHAYDRSLTYGQDFPLHAPEPPPLQHILPLVVWYDYPFSFLTIMVISSAIHVLGILICSLSAIGSLSDETAAVGLRAVIVLNGVVVCAICEPAIGITHSHPVSLSSRACLVLISSYSC